MQLFILHVLAEYNYDIQIKNNFGICYKYNPAVIF